MEPARTVPSPAAIELGTQSADSDDDGPPGPPLKRARRNPPRLARPSVGACNIGNSCFFSNASSRGRIPAHLLPPDLTEELGIRRHPDDYPLVTVRRSLEPDGGLGLFFRVVSYMMANTLIAVFVGPDTNAPGVSYHEFIEKWRHSCRLLADGHSKYAVNGADYCPAPCANDNFSRFNLYLVYNLTYRRMEVRTAFPLEKGDYEGTANYDHPGQPPTFWTLLRRNALPPEAQRECAFYYQTDSTVNSQTAKTLLRKRNRLMGRPRVSPPVVPPSPPRQTPTVATSSASAGSRKRPAECLVPVKKNETPTLPPGQQLLGHGLCLTNQPPTDPEETVPSAPVKVKKRHKLLPGQRFLGHGLRLEPQPAQTSQL